MITLEQLNAVPRPAWLTPFVTHEEIEGRIYAQSKDSRRETWEAAIDILDTAKAFDDTPRIGVFPAGRSFDEKIEFYLFAKAIAALFEDPKVRFYR